MSVIIFRFKSTKESIRTSYTNNRTLYLYMYIHTNLDLYVMIQRYNLHNFSSTDGLLRKAIITEIKITVYERKIVRLHALVCMDWFQKSQTFD